MINGSMRLREFGALVVVAGLAICAIPIGTAILVAEQARQSEKDAGDAKESNVDDSADRDYSDELPRIAPTSPEDAPGTFQVAEPFRIELVAAEPLVVDPVAMSFDENGRLFVAEMRDYSEDGDKNLGRIRMLADTDGDGRFDESTIYADGLSWPTAVICYGGGVFVGAAPDILYLEDTDGDAVADRREVIFTGFGRDNVQGLFNSFTWGLDNRIHGATSSSGASVVCVAKPREEATGTGKPVAHDDQTATRENPLVLRGRDFAFDPRTLEIEATSGGGQHGMSFDAWGDKFVCSNSDHAQMVLYEDRYLARNPYFASPSARRSIAADGPQADVFRISPVEPWRIVRTRLRVKGIVPGPVEGGGKAAGYFTGATGLTIYRGDAWPEQYRGMAIVGDVGSNLIHRKRLEDDGVAYVARRVDEKSEFVASRDIWFRPVQFANAPDGTLYVLDMYREVIEHPLSLPPVIKKHIDLTSGRDRGRIWRIVPEGFHQPALPKLGAASTAELVDKLDTANGWYRDTAARLLYQRQDASAVGPLEKLAASAGRAEGRIAALYAIDGLSALSPDVVLHSLDDSSPRVRRHAVRLAERVLADSPVVRDKLCTMTSDEDLRVQYQLAFTLGELEGPRRNVALTALARRHADDPLICMAVQSSLGEGAGAVLAELCGDKAFRGTGSGRAFIGRLAAQIGRQQRSDDVAAVLAILGRLSTDDPAVTQVLVESLAAKEGSELATQVSAATGGKADELLAELVRAARATAGDLKAGAAQRAAAIEKLRLGRFEENAALLGELLDPAQPVEVQTACLSTLAAVDSPDVAALLLKRWGGLSPSLRRRAGDVLVSRKQWIGPLLEAIESGGIAPVDVEPGRLQLLAVHDDEAISSTAKRILAERINSNRADVLTGYHDVPSREGDPKRGLEVFRKNCAACHQVAGIGHAIAPNLAAMRARGAEAILTAVLDPNREVNPQYLNYALVTQDGRVLSGMIESESATTIVLRRADGAGDTVLRIDIDQLKSTGQSLMPEGLEKEIDPQAMADLLSYLLAP